MMKEEVVALFRPTLLAHRLTSVEVVASPFRSFRAMERFQEMLGTIPGVRVVHTRCLQRGVLQVRVDCPSAVDLLDALRDADHATVPLRIVSYESHRIEVALEMEASRRQEKRPAREQRDPVAVGEHS